MSVAALYDIHGNLPALDAVLHEVQRANVDQIVVGGDVVPGPMTREALARLRSLDIPTQFIQGNCEDAMLAVMNGTLPNRLPERFRDLMRWVAEQLPPDYLDWLSSWPKTLSMPIDGLGEVLFCHATPRDNNEIFTRLTPEDRLLPIFDSTNASVVVCGHTHMQFDRMIGKTRVVNAGSVGSPFGTPGACWLLLDSDIQLRHTSYDLAQAADTIRATPYPQAEEFAEQSVLHPASDQQMLEEYTKAGLK